MGFIRSADKHRVVVADNSVEFRTWLRELLKDVEDLQIVAEADTAGEVLRLVSDLSPDLVIVDLYLPDRDGFQLARTIWRRQSGVRVIVVGVDPGPPYAKMEAAEGTAVFLAKSRISVDTLRQAVSGA